MISVSSCFLWFDVSSSSSVDGSLWVMALPCADLGALPLYPSQAMRALLSSSKHASESFPHGPSIAVCTSPDMCSLPASDMWNGSTYLFSISSSQSGLDLAQNIADKQNAVNQHPVRGALDFEVAEECVCAKQCKDFVQRVV